MSIDTRRVCFISYAHEDVDNDSLDYFLYLLKDALSPNSDVITDKEVKPGEDFNIFMNRVSNVDAIIPILTPAYKRRVQERKGGVFAEFSRFITRYEKNQDSSLSLALQNGTAFQILPVLFSGTRDQSVPDRISSLKCLDLSDSFARIEANGEFNVSQLDCKRFCDVVNAIANQINVISEMRSLEYITKSKYYVNLFVDTKATWNDPGTNHNHLLQKLFVKTNSYDLVAMQQVFFIVGRKGSGKSTISQALPLLNPERIIHSLEINADHYNLEALFALFSTTTYKDDTERFFPRLQGFEMTWESVILISALSFLVKEKNDRIHDIRPIKDFLDSLTDSSMPQSEGISWSTSDLFSYCFSRNLSFIQDCIAKARSEPEDAFWADISSLYSRENFLRYIFGSDTLKLCRNHLRAFQGTLLVSLDGFDDAFDAFRVESMRIADKRVLQSRASFEIDWLRSLLAFTLRAYRKRDNILYSRLEFCIAAPLDRFLEVARINRDSYRAIGRWHSINWSGIELSILLRKRLEFTLSDNLSSPKNIRPEERLSYILRSRNFKHLPEDVSFDYNGKSYEMPLFLYVLRHTFWRPREVLIYYARLLALADTRKRWKTHIDTQSLRSCIKSAAEDIIKSQFVNEFKTSLFNIDDVLRGFRTKPNFMSFNLLSEILVEIDFQFCADVFKAVTLVEKVRYLYQIGFLGIDLSPAQLEQHGALHSNAFIFNEGALLFGDEYLCQNDLALYSFLIHPIFCEYLKLDVNGSTLSLVFDWDYLHCAESALRARQMSSA
jgi:hypothetical protein